MTRDEAEEILRAKLEAMGKGDLLGDPRPAATTTPSGGGCDAIKRVYASRDAGLIEVLKGASLKADTWTAAIAWPGATRTTVEMATTVDEHLNVGKGLQWHAQLGPFTSEPEARAAYARVRSDLSSCAIKGYTGSEGKPYLLTVAVWRIAPLGKAGGDELVLMKSTQSFDLDLRVTLTNDAGPLP